MDGRQLRFFLAVAEELHFGRAAERLHVAGPAVSQTIRALERELGVTLFDRTNRRVTLTDAGELLRGEARAVVERLDAARAAMATYASGETGRVRIGAVPALPPQLVPGLLARFAEHAPGVDVLVRATPGGRSAAELLDAAGLDVALVRDEVGAPGIAEAVVATEPVGVALPRTHPLADRADLRARDLEGEPLVAFARDADPVQHDRIFAALGAAGLERPRVVHESHQGAVESSLRLVEQSHGLSLKLRSEVKTFGSPDIVWRPLTDVDLDVLVTAAWREDRVSPALARLLPLLLLDPSHHGGRDSARRA